MVRLVDSLATIPIVSKSRNTFMSEPRKVPNLNKPVNHNLPASHKVNHHRETTMPNVACRLRRLDPMKPKVAKAETEHM